MKKHLTKILLLIFLAISISAQTEILTNATVIEMSKIGLDKQIILKKIGDSPNRFDVSANALIELKKASVADEVIALMLEKSGATKFELDKPNDTSQNFSESL